MGHSLGKPPDRGASGERVDGSSLGQTGTLESMDARELTRRRLLQLGAASTAALGLGFVKPLSLPRSPRMKPMIVLDVDPDQMLKRGGEILDWVQHYRPQTNNGRLGPWDPRRPRDPRNHYLLPDHGKPVKASEISLTLPPTYSKARQVIRGIHRLQALADARAMRLQLDGMLFTGLQAHTVTFDHPNLGVVVPEGWSWDWILTVPHAVANAHRRAWTDAGYRFEYKPSVALARQQVAGRGHPTGWLRANRDRRTAVQYTVMPDLRVPECRAWLIERYRAVLEETRLRCLDIGLKSGWLHGEASVRNTPAKPYGADPWLPSPYPGDSYRDAAVQLALEASAALGEGIRVSATNTGIPPQGSDPHLPEYVRKRHGGFADLPSCDGLHGYWTTILRLK